MNWVKVSDKRYINLDKVREIVHFGGDMTLVIGPDGTGTMDTISITSDEGQQAILKAIKRYLED